MFHDHHEYDRWHNDLVEHPTNGPAPIEVV